MFPQYMILHDLFIVHKIYILLQIKMLGSKYKENSTTKYIFNSSIPPPPLPHVL